MMMFLHRMRHRYCIFIGVFFCLFQTGCHSHPSNEENAIREMVCTIHTQYPAATLQDVYKTCYQDRFGAEHAAPDSARALAYFLYELDRMIDDTLGMPVCEPCGYRHRYERVSLALVQSGDMAVDELLHEFLEAARIAPEQPAEAWAEEWGRIETIALTFVPDWKNEELINGLREAAERNAAVHHSSSFHDTYHPHYRIRLRK